MDVLKKVLYAFYELKETSQLNSSPEESDMKFNEAPDRVKKASELKFLVNAFGSDIQFQHFKSYNNKNPEEILLSLCQITQDEGKLNLI